MAWALSLISGGRPTIIGSPYRHPYWIGSGERRFSRFRPLSGAPEAPATLAFEAALGGRLAAAYPAGADGTVTFPFSRLFFVVARPDA